MKKLVLLLTGLALCGTVSVFAQGTVTFANSSATLAKTNNLGVIGNATVGSAVFQLVYLPQSGTNPPVGVFIDPASALVSFNGMEAIAGTTGLIAPGRFNGGTKTTGNDVVGGTPAWFQVIGWSAQFADIQAAATGGGLVGVSAVWSNPTGNPLGTPPSPAQAFIFGPAGFNGITIAPVPEPTTIALGGLGVAALLLFRRRK
jgi:hypothetical protein